MTITPTNPRSFMKSLMYQLDTKRKQPHPQLSQHQQKNNHFAIHVTLPINNNDHARATPKSHTQKWCTTHTHTHAHTYQEKSSDSNVLVHKLARVCGLGPILCGQEKALPDIETNTTSWKAYYAPTQPQTNTNKNKNTQPTK